VASCASLAVLGGAADTASALVLALASRGVLLNVSDAASADVVVFLHALGGADPVGATFADCTTLAARTALPKLLVHVADASRAGAGAAGVVKTAGREWSAEYICVSNANAAEVVERLADEIAYGAGEREVRWGTSRAVLARVEAPFSGPVRPVPAGPWIVSGGARGVTAACCVALAKAGMRRVVLLGRSALTEEPAVCRGAKDEAALKRALISGAEGKPRSRPRAAKCVMPRWMSPTPMRCPRSPLMCARRGARSPVWCTRPVCSPTSAWATRPPSSSRR
jgi:hypothetical protein